MGLPFFNVTMPFILQGVECMTEEAIKPNNSKKKPHTGSFLRYSEENMIPADVRTCGKFDFRDDKGLLEIKRDGVFGWQKVKKADAKRLSPDYDGSRGSLKDVNSHKAKKADNHKHSGRNKQLQGSAA